MVSNKTIYTRGNRYTLRVPDLVHYVHLVFYNLDVMDMAYYGLVHHGHFA